MKPRDDQAQRIDALRKEIEADVLRLATAKLTARERKRLERGLGQKRRVLRTARGIRRGRKKPAARGAGKQ